MANEFTKCSEVYDDNKIGVGDTIEFNEYSLNPFSRYGKVIGKRVGIVTKVESDCVWITTQDDYHRTSTKNFGLLVSRAEEISMVYRTQFNAKGDEQYGRK